MLNEYPDVLRVSDVAKILRIGRDGVYHLLKSGELHCKKVGRQYRIPKRCLVDYLRAAEYTSIAQ